MTTKERVSSFPDLPTSAEGDLAGYETYTWNALFGSAKMPADIVAKLNKAANDALKDENVKKRLEDVSAVTIGSTPEALGEPVRIGWRSGSRSPRPRAPRWSEASAASSLAGTYAGRCSTSASAASTALAAGLAPAERMVASISTKPSSCPWRSAPFARAARSLLLKASDVASS